MTSAAWDTSCPDWEARLREGRSLVPALPLIESEASRAVAIFDNLRLPDVPGQPLLRDAAGDWQRDLVRALFGSYDPQANVRHVREVFELVPKKNSKTTKGAAIMLTATLMSRRPRAEFLLVAPTQEVSNLAFAQAVGMIEADPVLTARFHVQDHIKKLTYRPTGAFLKIKSFDPKVVTGSKPAGVLLDELHVIAEANDADRVIGQLRGGLISQPEAFLVTITTQSERAPAGVFRSELRKARNVRDGKLRAPILPLLYEFPKGVDWRDPSNWHMVTPNNGLSITIDRLVTEFEAAQAGDEEEVRRWASQHLNVEIGLALLSDAWAGAEDWETQATAGLSLDDIIERSEVLTVGIDGGGKDDLLGLAVLGRDSRTQEWLLWTHAWAHTRVLERRQSIASRLRDFEADGDLTIVEHMGDDMAELARFVERVVDSGKLDKVGVDQSGIGAILDTIFAVGVADKQAVGISQGYKLQSAIKTAERKLAEGALHHGGQPMMSWCVGNARVEQKGNAILITKQASGVAKIDPLLAAFNAIELMSRNPQALAGDAAGFFDDPIMVGVL